MDLGELETTVKVIVVGNGGVGKSSMTARYCRGVFTSTYKKTIGVDFLEKTIDVGDLETVKLMIWDTAGQEEFDALTASYYRGTGACALVFSTIDRASFEAVEKWKRKVEEQCGPIAMVMVQNKVRGGERPVFASTPALSISPSPFFWTRPWPTPPPPLSFSPPQLSTPQVDLIQESAVTVAEVEALARKLNICLFRTCVKDNLNVSEVFESLAAQYIRAGGSAAGAPPAVPAVGDLGAVGGHRTGAGGGGAGGGSGGSGGGGEDSAGDLVAPSAASPERARPAAAGGGLVREPAAGGAGAAAGGGGGGAPLAAAAAGGKGGAQKERVVDHDAPAAGATVKLGADGRRKRPSKGILSYC
jgi:Ras-related protein Rab-23